MQRALQISFDNKFLFLFIRYRIKNDNPNWFLNKLSTLTLLILKPINMTQWEDKSYDEKLL